ncbi:MAG: phosphonate metabolism protein/1,5-bisphosphokinase (PRPP-forming) PhnN [Hyphomicrobiales bacterium]|nr:phosphonate metabolism protein/1,5-bisphosphokinase (PRPP-forming) PhnN [Hyphomicrobiales bacterium]
MDRSAAGGLFVAVVGPSGAGKDTLINGLRERLGEAESVFYARRVVTRQSDAFEDHDTLAEDAFLREREAGRFALSWPAHGLHYGVPAEIDQWIARGGAVVCNVSRAVVSDVRRRYPHHLVVLVTASPATLAARLAARGRESEEGRRRRLDRASAPDVAFEADAVVANDGAIGDAVAQLRDLIVAAHARFRA